MPQYFPVPDSWHQEIYEEIMRACGECVEDVSVGPFQALHSVRQLRLDYDEALDELDELGKKLKRKSGRK